MHKSWFSDMMLIDCFYQGLSLGTKRLIDNLISGGLDKKMYAALVDCLTYVAKMNTEVEKDFMLAILMVQMDDMWKRMIKIEAQSKRKDKYIPPHERKGLTHQEAKRKEGMLLNILLKVNKQDKKTGVIERIYQRDKTSDFV